MRRTCLHKIVLSAALLLKNSFLVAQKGIINGKVEYGKDPLQLATVTLENRTVFTNCNGEFSSSVKSGSYTLIISYVGYRKIERVVSAIAGICMSGKLYPSDLIVNIIFKSELNPGSV